MTAFLDSLKADVEKAFETHETEIEAGFDAASKGGAELLAAATHIPASSLLAIVSAVDAEFARLMPDPTAGSATGTGAGSAPAATASSPPASAGDTPA